jgi:two-component system, NarL family, response regulator NreC
MDAIRLLLVDDHAVVRDAIAQLLSSDPQIQVTGTAADGESGLRLAGKLQPDLVLLDISLPDADGLELIGAFHARCPTARVLMLSMHSESEYVARAGGKGAYGLVSKSESPEGLLAAIHQVSEGRSLDKGRRLTSREEDVLRCLAEGLSTGEMAEALGLQPKTVEGYCQELMDRLDVHTRVGLIRYARRLHPRSLHS